MLLGTAQDGGVIGMVMSDMTSYNFEGLRTWRDCR